MVEHPSGRTSSTWRIWTNGRTSDVYFGHRDAAGEIKGSLHASGSWQYGLTKERLPTAQDVRGWDGKSRHLMRWKRPREMTPGLTLAVEFAFPTEELQLIPGLDRTGCIILPAAPDGQAALVALFFAKPGAYLGGSWPGEVDMNSMHIANFPLPSRERVFLVHTVMTPPPITRVDLDNKRREFAPHMPDSSGRRGRFCSVVFNDDGSRLFIEGAVHPDRVALP